MFYHADSLVDVVVTCRLGSYIDNILLKTLLHVHILVFNYSPPIKWDTSICIWSIWRERERLREREGGRERERESALAGLYVWGSRENTVCTGILYIKLIDKYLLINIWTR